MLIRFTVLFEWGFESVAALYLTAEKKRMINWLDAFLFKDTPSIIITVIYVYMKKCNNSALNITFHG